MYAGMSAAVTPKAARRRPYSCLSTENKTHMFRELHSIHGNNKFRYNYGDELGVFFAFFTTHSKFKSSSTYSGLDLKMVQQHDSTTCKFRSTWTSKNNWAQILSDRLSEMLSLVSAAPAPLCRAPRLRSCNEASVCLAWSWWEGTRLGVNGIATRSIITCFQRASVLARARTLYLPLIPCLVPKHHTEQLFSQKQMWLLRLAALSLHAHIAHLPQMPAPARKST